MSNSAVRKAAVLIGLSIVISGAWEANAATTCTVKPAGDAAVLIGLRVVKSDVCDANADTTSPMTETFPLSTLADDSASDNLLFAQNNSPLAALNSIDFSLNSSMRHHDGERQWRPRTCPANFEALLARLFGDDYRVGHVDIDQSGRAGRTVQSCRLAAG
jgi:hypothetical protein